MASDSTHCPVCREPYHGGPRRYLGADGSERVACADEHACADAYCPAARCSSQAALADRPLDSEVQPVTNPDNLTSRVRAAVQQRLDLARAATPGPWRWVRMPDPIQRALRSESDSVYFDETRSPLVLPSANIGDENAAFIAANSPDVVERHCLADLRRLERHAPKTRSPGGWFCAHCDYGFNIVLWPCVEFRDVAEAYAIDLAIASGEERQ